MKDRGNKYAEVKLPKYSRDFTDDQYMLMYENWIIFIRKIVPPEKLLIFNVKNGIAPLAKDFFQNLPTKRGFHRVLNKMKVLW